MIQGLRGLAHYPLLRRNPLDYDITTTWKEATGVMLNQWEGPDRLNGKYADVDKTEFHLTVPEQIESESIVIPRFDLTKKKGK